MGGSGSSPLHAVRLDLTFRVALHSLTPCVLCKKASLCGHCPQISPGAVGIISHHNAMSLTIAMKVSTVECIAVKNLQIYFENYIKKVSITPHKPKPCPLQGSSNHAFRRSQAIALSHELILPTPPNSLYKNHP